MILALVLSAGAWAGNSTLPPPVPRGLGCGRYLTDPNSLVMRVVTSRVHLRLRNVIRDRQDVQRGFLHDASLIIEILTMETEDKGRWREVDRGLQLILVNPAGIEHRLDGTVSKRLSSAFPAGRYLTEVGVVFNIESDIADVVMLDLHSEVLGSLAWGGQEYHRFGLHLSRPLNQSDEWTVLATAGEGESAAAAYDATIEDQTATVIDYLADGRTNTVSYADSRKLIAEEMIEDITDELDELVIRAVPPPLPSYSRLSRSSKVFHKPRAD